MFPKRTQNNHFRKNMYRMQRMKKAIGTRNNYVSSFKILLYPPYTHNNPNISGWKLSIRNKIMFLIANIRSRCGINTALWNSKALKRLESVYLVVARCSSWRIRSSRVRIRMVPHGGCSSTSSSSSSCPLSMPLSWPSVSLRYTSGCQPTSASDLRRTSSSKRLLLPDGVPARSRRLAAFFNTSSISSW